jgi:hypothetical protein
MAARVKVTRRDLFGGLLSTVAVLVTGGVSALVSRRRTFDGVTVTIGDLASAAGRFDRTFYRIGDKGPELILPLRRFEQ